MSVLFRGKNEKWHIWWRRLHGGPGENAACSSARRQLSFLSYGWQVCNHAPQSQFVLKSPITKWMRTELQCDCHHHGKGMMGLKGRLWGPCDSVSHLWSGATACYPYLVERESGCKHMQHRRSSSRKGSECCVHRNLLVRRTACFQTSKFSVMIQIWGSKHQVRNNSKNLWAGLFRLKETRRLKTGSRKWVKAQFLSITHCFSLILKDVPLEDFTYKDQTDVTFL